MQIQFSTTENCTSPLLLGGYSFEGVPTPTDPPDNTGGGGGTNSNESDEEEDEPTPESQ